MTLSVHDGTTKPAARLHVRKAGATLLASSARIRSGGALKAFFSTLAANLSAYSIFGYVTSASARAVNSSPVTATATGAVGTPTYLWTRTDGGAQAWTINSPTAATTTFGTTCSPTDEFVATFKCTVTDPLTGLSVDSAEVTADCANLYGGGFP
jgi:hypothetical protein